MSQLLSVERWIEQLVEEPFVRLFAGKLLPQDVARHLLRALEDGEHVGRDGRTAVPGSFYVELNRDDLAALLHDNPDLDAQLTRALAQVIEHMALRTDQRPSVRLRASETLAPRAVRIAPDSHAGPPPGHTRELTPASVSRVAKTRDARPRPQAYLIIKGDRTFDLTTSQITIGRALDNDLILEDTQVSRHHALLRYRYGRFILEDLGSTGGTAVNGFEVQEIVLRAGDLISLSGVDIIYVENRTAGPGKSGTQPIGPARG